MVGRGRKCLISRCVPVSRHRRKLADDRWVWSAGAAARRGNTGVAWHSRHRDRLEWPSDPGRDISWSDRNCQCRHDDIHGRSGPGENRVHPVVAELEDRGGRSCAPWDGEQGLFSVSIQPLPAIGEPFNASVPFSAGGMTSLQLLPYERDMISFYLAGPVAAELERAGTDAMEDACRETVVSVFGSKMGAALHTPKSVTWGRIETIGGAYASALPGHAEARLRLGEPVGNRLFFAGEATHPSFFSTCHGAHLSGIRAIEEVVETRSRRLTEIPLGGINRRTSPTER